MSDRAAMGRLSPLLDGLRSNYPGPCLIFDLVAMRDAADALARIGRRTGVRFIAAVKALPTVSLLDMASHVGGGFDVSNIGELRRLCDSRRAGSGAGDIPYVSMSGPAMSSGAGIAKRSIHCLSINIETPSQLASVDDLSGWATDIEIGARIGFDSPAPADDAPRAMSRFGVSEYDTDSLNAIVAHPRFAALHCHLEGHLKPVGSYVAAASRLVALAHTLKTMPRRINLGGGFRNESVADIEKICRDVRATVPADVEIIFEPGHWLTAQAGYAFCRLLWMRDRPDLKATLAVADLSRECHLRWETPQLLRWWGAPPARETVMVFGPTCYEADHLGTFHCNAGQAVAQAGDDGWLLFGGISGYAAAFNTAFNGIDRATVLTIGNAG